MNGGELFSTHDDISEHALTDALQRVFGFPSFRPHQHEIVAAILAGRDVFTALPTGGGKSLCYQLPSILLGGVTVVVSPLIALMQDQVFGATQNGLAAAFLNSTLDAAGVRSVWSRLRSGEVSLLYVAPERLAIDGFREQLHEIDVRLFAIDEAHCISEWGHEFRPDYRSLSVLRNEFPGTPIAAFTATATRQVQDDVIRLLSLNDPLCIRASFDRPEIFYRAVRKDRVADQILSFVLSHRDEAGIVYRATRKSVEQTAVHLSRHGVVARPYHAGLPDEDRRNNQAAFVRDEVRVIVATIAFGMGIDKPNVRWIVHGDMPRSIEAYYQETGRAGRDGDAAQACLFYGPQDIVTARYHIDRMQVPAERERADERLREMIRFATSGVCRRTQLLAHFDEHREGSCGTCDICAGENTTTDRSVEAQKAMSAIVRTGERFGAHHIADIVCGTESERVVALGHDALPTFGVGSDEPREFWLALLGDLEAGGLVQRRDGAKSGLAISQSGRRVLRGEESFRVAEGGRMSSASRSRRREPELVQDISGDELDALFSRLRSLRSRLAREQSVPSYLVFSDKSLRDMALRRPRTHEEFLRVHGVGERKAELYEQEFLALIQQDAE